jgi:putative tryptophan/tyrosine transport system substrate-binding protein
VRRRAFLALVGTAAFAPFRAAAQGPNNQPRIGFLGNSTPTLEARLVDSFRKGLSDLGYVEGRSISIEYRWAEGDYDRLPSLVRDLVKSKVAMIVTAGTPAALAVKEAGSSVPLVMIAVGDPVGTGLVSSLARPGGNVTGLTSMTPELEGKRQELIKEVVPAVSRLAVFWNPANAYQTGDAEQVQAAALVLNVPVLSLPVRTGEELDNAFAKVLAEGADAALILADRLFLHNRQRIVDFLVKNRLPAMSAYRELVEAGGLMSFGPSYAVMHRQAASYVDKMLKGAKPADLPEQQPAKFEFVVNLKSAGAIGVTIPHAVLLRADEVIE